MTRRKAIVLAIILIALVLAIYVAILLLPKDAAEGAIRPQLDLVSCVLPPPR